MTQLIADVRLMADAGTAEHSVNGTTYYTDDDIQRYLDKRRHDVYRERMHFEPEYVAGSAEYHHYYWLRGAAEEAESGTTAWVVTDGAGSAIGTGNYSANYEARQLRFSADTQGTVYYLTYRAYDLNMVASEIWRDKAAHVSNRFDVKTDNHDLKRSQLRKMYMDNAMDYRSKAKPRHVRMVREDLNP
jgi:hypothetical protein